MNSRNTFGTGANFPSKNIHSSLSLSISYFFPCFCFTPLRSEMYPSLFQELMSNYSPVMQYWANATAGENWLAQEHKQFQDIQHEMMVSVTFLAVFYQFTQQNLPSCKPVLTPAVVIATLLLMGFIFIPVGLVALRASNSA
ncbi:hypothetical protein JHK85_043590 [Glycine max]|nr:hypothetical protein JHK85_043590 [Glycine max]